MGGAAAVAMPSCVAPSVASSVATIDQPAAHTEAMPRRLVVLLVLVLPRLLLGTRR
jgi:hypothetical protein